MIDWLASFGAGIIRAIALLSILYASIWLTIKLGDFAPHRFTMLGERTRMAIGFVVWAVLFMGAIVTFGPALEALHRFECRDARDFELCMNPPDADYL